MSKLAGDRLPGLEQPGIPRHEVDPALDENPLLADAAPDQFLGQGLAAGRVMPEQIVGDEDVVADRLEILDDGLDRALAHGARMELPDGTERATERAPPGRLDQPDRPMRETRVVLTPGVDMATRGQRHGVQRKRSGLQRGAHLLPVSIEQRQAGDGGQFAPLRERSTHVRQHPLTIVDDDGADVGPEKRRGVGRRGVTADDDRTPGDRR